jgi:glucokinase
MLKNAPAKNDRLVSNILRETARELGKACVSLRHVLDPEMILFGGGLVEACGDFLLPRIQKEIESDPFFSMLPPLRLATASLEDDAAVLGGAALIQKHLGLELRRVPDSPSVDLPGKETLAVDGEARTSDCVIRADGTVRERNLKKAVKATGSIDRIGPGELAKILKGNPDVFFLGTGFRKKIGLTRAALAYLREREVEWKRLDTPGAARAYNRCDRRKAAFFRVTG